MVKQAGPFHTSEHQMEADVCCRHLLAKNDNIIEEKKINIFMLELGPVNVKHKTKTKNSNIANQ